MNAFGTASRKRELHLRDIGFVLPFLPRALAVIALFEVDRGAVRRRCQLVSVTFLTLTSTSSALGFVRNSSISRV